MVSIREAERRDAAPLSALAEQTFRDTFEASNTVEDMALHCRTSYGEDIQAAEIAHPRRVTLLAEEGVLIGFAQLRWETAPGCVTGEAPGELQRLYVAREWHGRGVAQRLMDASFDALRQRGLKTVWLGVWEHNPRAIAFYQKLGFEACGAHVFPLGTDPQRDIVMARAL